MEELFNINHQLINKIKIVIVIKIAIFIFHKNIQIIKMMKLINLILL